MKKVRNKLALAVLAVAASMVSTSAAAQQATMCYSSKGAHMPCGSSWTEYRNGVEYRCTCNCSKIPPAQCVPVSSGSPSNEGIKRDKAFETLGEVNNLMNVVNSFPDSGAEEEKLKQQQEELKEQKALEDARYQSAAKMMKKMPGQNSKSYDGYATQSNDDLKDGLAFKPVPMMGNTPLTADERERMRAYNLKSIPDNRLDESNFRREESPFWTSPEMIKLETEALKFTAGFVPGGIIATAGADIISGILNKKSGQEIIYDTALGLAGEGIGKAAGAAVGSGLLSIKGLGGNTIVLKGDLAKQDFEIASKGADMLINAWKGIEK